MKPFLLLLMLSLILAACAPVNRQSADVVPSVIPQDLSDDRIYEVTATEVDPGMCVGTWSGPALAYQYEGFTVSVDRELKTVAYQYPGQIIAVVEGSAQIFVSVSTGPTVIFFACFDDEDRFLLYADIPEGAEVKNRPEPDVSVFPPALREWSAFYCLDTSCATHSGYNQTGAITEGEPVGCPTWVEVVTGYRFDPIYKRNVPTTIFVYVSTETCDVRNVIE